MSNQCREKDCQNKVFVRGLCNSHYGIVRSRELGTCSVNDCNNLIRGKGLCAMHLNRLRKHGSLDLPAKLFKACDVEGCAIKVASTVKLCKKHYKKLQYSKQCAADNCSYKARARGYCRKHRELSIKAAALDASPRVCIVDKCNKVHSARGYCQAHYQQVRNGIEPKAFVECLHCGLPIRENKYYKKLHTECVQAREDDMRYRKKFGIGLDEYDRLFNAQNGVCAICKEQDTQKLAIDHDHKTGDVRGLLCRACNTGIGLLKDDAQLLKSAIDYLQTNGSDAFIAQKAAA